MEIGPTTTATTLRLFADALEDLGVGWEALFRDCGVDPEVLRDSEARIPHTDFDRVWIAAGEVTHDLLIGLHAGEHVKPHAVNVFGYLLLSSATLGEGLERVARFQGALTPVPWVAFHREPPWVRVRVGMDHGDPELRAIHAEYVAPMVLSFLGWVGGSDVHAVEVRFAHAARGPVSEYERVLACPVKFECPESEVVIPETALEQPSLHANSRVAELHVSLAARLLAEAEDRSTSARTRRALAPLLESGPRSLAAVARRMHMSPRTLQRRLTEEGTAFTEVLDDLRRDLALEHLGHRRQSIAEIAYLAGFSSPSAFTRAVQRWFGCTPGELRTRDAARAPTAAL